MEQLHLLDYVEALRKAQYHFEKIYREKLSEQKQYVPKQTRDVRLQLVDTYRLVLTYTEVNAQATSDKAHLADLLRELNSVRKRYKTNRRKGCHNKSVDSDPSLEPND